MPLFDPAAVNRQIDSYLAAVPPGKRVTLMGQVDLVQGKASAALILRPLDHVGAYIRVGKPKGQQLEADIGFTASFLFEDFWDGFTYEELVAVFKARGWGWIRSHLAAFRLLRGWSVEL